MNYCMRIKKYTLIIGIMTFIMSCANPVPRKPISRKTSDVVDASITFNRNLNALEEQAFKKLIELDSTSNYHSSSNGFWYKIDEKSAREYLPKFGDQLTFKYSVYDMNFKTIYSEKEIGEQSYVVDQTEIQEGLRNGLKLMNEGDSYTFLFPSHKMFGYVGDDNKVGINQPLIYKVQLNKIKRKDESN